MRGSTLAIYSTNCARSSRPQGPAMISSRYQWGGCNPFRDRHRARKAARYSKQMHLQSFRFQCRCGISDLNLYETGLGKSKKQAKTEAAKLVIDQLVGIPDAQAVMIQIMMASSMNENLLMQEVGKKRVMPDTMLQHNPQLMNPVIFQTSQPLPTVQSRSNAEAANRFILNHLGISGQKQQPPYPPQIIDTDISPHRTVVNKLAPPTLFKPEDLEKAEQTKQVFEQLQSWATKRGITYEFTNAPADNPGEYRRLLYFGKDLIGIGDGQTQRQAKINCARVALQNLEEGKTMQRPVSKDGFIAFLRENNDPKSILSQDMDEVVKEQQQIVQMAAIREREIEEQRRLDQIEQERKRRRDEKEALKQSELQRKLDEKRKKKEVKRRLKQLESMAKMTEKEKRKEIRLMEKRSSISQKYQVSQDELKVFEAYCLQRCIEIQLSIEDQYDFVKFMLKMQEFKKELEGLGVINLIPVGSSVNKVVRKSNFLVDIILNFNQKNINDANDHKSFQEFAEKLRSLIDDEFTRTGYFISSTQLYRTQQQQQGSLPVYSVTTEHKGPFCALINVTNNYDKKKLNARFFIQEISQLDTFYSIKHWNSMMQTMKDDIKFSVVLRLLKQWRDHQGLQCVLYPEVLDSVLQMTVINQHSLDDQLVANVVINLYLLIFQFSLLKYSQILARRIISEVFLQQRSDQRLWSSINLQLQEPVTLRANTIFYRKCQAKIRRRLHRQQRDVLSGQRNRNIRSYFEKIVL
ncbi:hypothetical protein FGO68_gene2765 [Halteria grandinella]|uniref:DRBM domain-containing protein n=1 Tax=Halteria grandinella TaxID=5974 RepID=A0A8J8NZ29_HALGN|nr:hypothetical protein FGO68_gene2765 [Halteria grandinella]